MHAKHAPSQTHCKLIPWQSGFTVHLYDEEYSLEGEPTLKLAQLQIYLSTSRVLAPAPEPCYDEIRGRGWPGNLRNQEVRL